MKERRIGKEIKKVQVLMARYITKYMKNRENEVFSRIQIDIMEFLSKSEEDVYQKDLEQEFDLRKPTISGILKTMEKNEVIERVEAKQDSRSKNLLFTVTGNYIAVINFVLSIEDDSQLGFRIENFKILPGSGENGRQATFTVRNVRIKQENATSAVSTDTSTPDAQQATDTTDQTGTTDTNTAQ